MLTRKSSAVEISQNGRSEDTYSRTLKRNIIPAHEANDQSYASKAYVYWVFQGFRHTCRTFLCAWTQFHVFWMCMTSGMNHIAHDMDYMFVPSYLHYVYTFIIWYPHWFTILAGNLFHRKKRYCAVLFRRETLTSWQHARADALQMTCG
jgi:hypothetical protein